MCASFFFLLTPGEALTLDLSDLIASLYALILPLGLSTDIEASPARAAAPGGRSSHAPSTADLLFRALDLAFAPRTLGASAPSTRSAAFAKRTLTAALAWPPATILRAIDFVSGLLSKDSRLEALLAADDDRAANGVYRPEIDDPQLSNALGAATLWELGVLQEHSDAHVREAARRLSHFTRE
jgi:nucleolar complex protein 3